MIQIIGLLAISWLIVWLFDKSSLSILGLMPTKHRLVLVITLFLVTAICCSSAFLLKIYFAKEQYSINPELNTTLIFSGIWENISSVLTEELLCRGVGLYILIKLLGNKKAILISSIIFGMLHWLNNGILGNPIQMIVSFLFTFCMGLLLAYAYSRTFSVLIPFAIHLGWNLTQNFIFPDLQNGNTIFIMAIQPPVITVSYFVFFFMILFPKTIAIGLDYLIIKKNNDLKNA